jgi:hypothetical protein
MNFVLRRTIAICMVGCVLAAGCQPPGPSFAERGPNPLPIAPLPQEDIRAAMDRGVAFLLEAQNPNGSWGSSYDKPVTVLMPIPGGHRAMYAGTTALCIMALCETAPDTPEVDAALRRAQEWLFKTLPKLRRDDIATIYCIWGHAYSIQALLRLQDRLGADAERDEAIREFVELQIHLLGQYQSLMGGWAYYERFTTTRRPNLIPNSFVTATVLIALHEAHQAGYDVPERLPLLGMKAIRWARHPDFSYGYYSLPIPQPTMELHKKPASLGRSQTCNAAMYLWGDEQTTLPIIKTWLDRLYARNGWLSRARKTQNPHESWFAVAGYFFYYGHYYAAVCIDLLPQDERPYFQDHLANILVPLQETDGSWWDFPIFRYHQEYGTAFALMSLERCLHADN